MTIAGLLVVFGLLFIILELIIGIEAGFDLVVLGGILIIGGATGHYFGNTMLALGLSVVVSVLYLVFARSYVKSKLVVIARHTNVDKLVGSKGVVVRGITPDTAGMVRVDDEDWRASADSLLYEKDHVEVVALEGVTLHVRKSK